VSEIQTGTVRTKVPARLAARAADAQLVVLNTRGEAPARMLGAVSQHVLRHAPCPALVVPGWQQEAFERRDRSIRNELVSR
jgi:nucleotide-binding universal stress UspA family protein